MYKLAGGNLTLGAVACIQPGRHLASDVELLQSGKHPGKTNITDADNALNILRYLMDEPCAVIVKHNNPCGAARASSLAEAYRKANMADRVAAFGGAIALNREVDRDTAALIIENYAEVVVAPEFGPGAMELFARKKNLRVMRIGTMARLREFAGGVVSNSVLYVKDGVTVSIGAGGQDRVGMAQYARDKAYRNFADRICWERHGIPYNTLADAALRTAIDEETATQKGGLAGSCMVSDAFFPFRDGVEVGLREGITAVIQPGGSERDFEVIEACNEAHVAMVFTGQRCFKH